MKHRQSTWLGPLIAVCAALAAGAGIWAATAMFSAPALDPDSLDATYMEGGREITDFSLVDHAGEPFTRDRLRGQWTLLFFGFTNCPDICPTTLLELGEARRQVLAQPDIDSRDLRIVFVTVDPARDTPERLRRYVTAFDADAIGVTGALDAIDVLARDVGIAHARHGEPQDDDYMVDHGSAILLVNPEGRLQALFQAPHRADVMSRDLGHILEHHARL